MLVLTDLKSAQINSTFCWHLLHDDVLVKLLFLWISFLSNENLCQVVIISLTLIKFYDFCCYYNSSLMICGVLYILVIIIDVKGIALHLHLYAIVQILSLTTTGSFVLILCL